MTLTLLNEQTTLLGESDIYFPGEQSKKMSSLITFKLACVIDVNKYLFFRARNVKGSTIYRKSVSLQLVWQIGDNFFLQINDARKYQNKNFGAGSKADLTRGLV